MANGPGGAVARGLETLWGAGAVGGDDDASLAARFVDRRDQAAFRVLVERHGPMVVRTCRQILGDDHEADDAAQAVFLVMARKAGSVRDRNSVAPWLHAVARRVAARIRRRSAARRAGQTRAAEAFGRTSAVVDETPVDWEAVHEEVARLPAKYRDPVVLCYLEGRTYEETARRLGAPVGTVRVRLSRARDRLRDRLARRGFGPPAFAPVPPAAAPAGWVEVTVDSALAFVSGRTVPASVLTLSLGVLRSMTLAKLKFAAAGLLAAVAVTAGGRALVGQEAERKPPPPRTPRAAATVQDDDRLREIERSEELRLASRLVETARRRLEAQRAYLKEGRITLDRYADASLALRSAEYRLAATAGDRVKAANAHLARMTELADREGAALKEGRGTAADLAEAEYARDLAELDVFDAGRSADRRGIDAPDGRLKAVEQPEPGKAPRRP